MLGLDTIEQIEKDREREKVLKVCVCVYVGTCEYELIALIATLLFNFIGEMFAVPSLPKLATLNNKCRVEIFATVK